MKFIVWCLSLVACASDTKGVVSLDAMKLEARG